MRIRQMIKGRRVCLLLILVLCFVAGGCSGSGNTEGGYDAIGDAGLGGISDMFGKKKEDTGIDPVTEELLGTWYGQEGSLIRIRFYNIKQKTYFSCDPDGNQKVSKWHSNGELSLQKEGDGSCTFFTSSEDADYLYVSYMPEEKILIARDEEDKDTLFKRTKYVPAEEELKGNAENYPAPDESFCGAWEGHAPEGSGSYSLSMSETDEAGQYQIEASLSKVSDDSGNGHDGLSVSIVDISAEAAMEEGVMMVRGICDPYSSTPESERMFKAVLLRHNEGLRLLVLESGSHVARPGDWYDFKRE